MFLKNRELHKFLFTQIFVYPLYACFYLSRKYGYSNIDSSHKKQKLELLQILSECPALITYRGQCFFGSNLTFNLRKIFRVVFYKKLQIWRNQIETNKQKNQKKNSGFVCSKLVVKRDSRELKRCFEIQKLSGEKEKKKQQVKNPVKNSQQ